jgi:hypothetical protein
MHAKKYILLYPWLQQHRRYEDHEKRRTVLGVGGVRLHHRYCGESGEKATKERTRTPKRRCKTAAAAGRGTVMAAVRSGGLRSRG